MRADIKEERTDRDERGKVWDPYETTGRGKGTERTGQRVRGGGKEGERKSLKRKRRGRKRE